MGVVAIPPPWGLGHEPCDFSWLAKQLREVTGQSARLCEKALLSHSDDMQRAADWLLSQGEAKGDGD